MLYPEGGGRTTLHLGPNSSEKLPNIQIGDQNIMMVGGTGACSRRKSKNNKKPKKNIEGLCNISGFLAAMIFSVTVIYILVHVL